jgi:hypothetical protein
MTVVPSHLVDLKGVLSENGKHCYSFVLARDERAKQVIERASDIEENVPSDNRYVPVQVEAKVQDVFPLIVGIKHFSHRAWLAVERNSNDRFQLIEMVFCPSELQSP